MNLYRAHLVCRSALGTPLAADTLWGHVAWAIRYDQGEQALLDWLDQYDTQSPPLIISDPFPHGFFPRPVLPPAHTGLARTRDQYRKAKERNTLQWIPVQRWAEIAHNCTRSAIDDALSPLPAGATPVTDAVLHAGVNRLTSGTDHDAGGRLHADVRDFFSKPTPFDLYALSPHPSDTVANWLRSALAGGYGRDASSGLGHIVVEHLEPCSFPSVARPNALLLLAPATPAPTDPVRGFAPIETRAGRLGGLFAIGPTPDGADTPQRQKHPVTRLVRGSVLLHEAHRPWVGRLLRNVHPYPQIRHYSIAPTLPCTLDQDLLQEANP